MIRVSARYLTPERYRQLNRSHGVLWVYGVRISPQRAPRGGCLGSESVYPDADPGGEYFGTPKFDPRRRSLSVSFSPDEIGAARAEEQDTWVGYSPAWCRGQWTTTLFYQRESCKQHNEFTDCSPDRGHARVVARSRFTVTGRDDPGCRVSRDELVQRSGSDLIFNPAVALTELWGCRQGVGRRFLLAADVDGIDGTWLALRLAGPFVAYGAYEANSCARYMNCPPGYRPTVFTAVVNLRTGEHHLSMDRPPTRDALVLTSSGAIAWIALQPGGGFQVRAYDPGGERVLDSGAGLDPDSLRLADNTITWTNAGVRHSATI